MQKILGVVSGVVLVGALIVAVHYFLPAPEAIQQRKLADKTVDVQKRVVQPVVVALPPSISPNGASTFETAPAVMPDARTNSLTAAPAVPAAPLAVAAQIEVTPVPLARVALDLVGVDADAEAVWSDAINDPNMAPDDRKNLIEDLNENGFADPAHPTADELPLIESRLALIEDMAPDAMDAINAAAFEEAYKDLADMHDKLTKK